MDMLLSLLPYLCLALLTYVLHISHPANALRSSLVSASLLWGVFLVVETEILSFFTALTQSAVLWVWIVATGILLVAALNMRQRMQWIFPWTFFKSNRVVLFLLCVGAATLITGMLYPPNTWDSMTYHMPKIEHWVQQQSLVPFETPITRQIILAPFAEMVILQTRIISGTDFFANTVQWLSYIGCLSLVSLITARLGGTTRQQLFAALFCATLPMAILQASSTQTDLVVAYWVLCTVERILAWKAHRQLAVSMQVGAALGLAMLTKGTAYPLCFVFVLVYAVSILKSPRRWFCQGLLAALIALVLNAPHLTRNYQYCGDPLGISIHPSAPALTLQTLPVVMYSGILSNIPQRRMDGTPHFNMDALLKDFSASVYAVLGVNFPTDGRYFWMDTHPLKAWNAIANEDLAPNPLHLLLILLAFPFALLGKSSQNRCYALYVLLTVMTFCLIISWQPWITRLQVPLFFLSAPLVAFALRNRQKLQRVVTIALICYAVFIAVRNESRPLFPGKNKWGYWNKSRQELYFTNRKDLASLYIAAAQAIVDGSYRKVGLVISENSWEYPLWVILNKSPHAISIHHACFKNVTTDQYDLLFVFEASNRCAQEQIQPDLNTLRLFSFPSSLKTAE